MVRNIRRAENCQYPDRLPKPPKLVVLLLTNAAEDVENRHVEGNGWCAGSGASAIWNDSDPDTCSEEQTVCTRELSCNRLSR